jgi:hypothetical protein
MNDIIHLYVAVRKVINKNMVLNYIYIKCNYVICKKKNQTSDAGTDKKKINSLFVIVLLVI